MNLLDYLNKFYFNDCYKKILIKLYKKKFRLLIYAKLYNFLIKIYALNIYYYRR